MTEEEQTDPLEIVKEPQTVKAAQVELSKIDVLVCGECHEVFHFIEQFQEHRSSNKCTKESALLESCQSESKSQLWSFMLWKNAKFKNSADEDSAPSSWNVYQLWCNLEQTQKDAWLAAGKYLQNINTVSSTKLLISSKSASKSAAKTRSSGKFKKGDEEESLEEGEIKLQKKPSKTSSDSKPNSEQDPLADTETDLDTEEELEKVKSTAEKCENGSIKKTLLKPVQLNSDITIIPSTKKVIKRAIRTNVDDKKTEYVVEKIVAKRYNPGKKTHEYLIKWENFDDDQNTWEPVYHLESCKALVEEFDRNLQKAKAQKLTKPPLVQRRVYKKTVVPVHKSEEVVLTPGGRPQRTSKQKALNQVKVWCGNISDADEGSGKRAYSDSDSDSFEKKFRLDADSSDSEDDRPPITVKRILKTSVNGVGKKQPLPENILVPDAQGVVRINQKQLPALSSGVYVMSKTAGIIRLDSNTSKIATSGGHAVIKLASKIGQTSVKVIRKDLPTNGSKPTILNQQGKLKQIQKPMTAKLIAQRNRIVSAIVKKPEQVPEPTKPIDEDSDGLEELPFPTDLPLPEPDSPPGEFTLCPLTGKILGQNDKQEDVVTVKQELTTETNPSAENVNIDNLAKLTAADILNESPAVKTEKEEGDVAEPMETEILPEVKDSKRAETEQTQSIEEALSAMEADTPVTTAPSVVTLSSTSTSSSSILSTALSNANIEPGTISTPVTVSTPTTPATPVSTIPKKLLNTTEAIRQKTAMNRSIINRTIIPKPAPQAIITRITPGSTLKQRQMISKPKFGVPPPTTFRKAVRQTYGNRNSSLVRKIGSTAVFASSSPIVSVSTTSTVEKSPAIINVNTTTESLVQTLTDNTPSAVINMPLLTDIETTNTSSTDVVNTEPEPPVSTASTENVNTDLNAAISLNDTETPLLITGEDGTIYQVAGQNEDGQTILIAQDADGQQQCLLVASESSTELTEPTTSTTAETTTVNAAPITTDVAQVEEPLAPVNTEPEPENEGTEDSQIVAQIVSAQPPSPGGTRKVVLMLPDGNLMMTEVTAEQYAALELDK